MDRLIFGRGAFGLLALRFRFADHLHRRNNAIVFVLAWRTEKAAGDPDQAVLLLSEETLADLRAEGWPVQAGDIGENLTVAGLPADALRPGVRVRLGEVVLEVSKACDPCTILHTLPYVGLERGPAFLRAMAGRRGWFARVLQGGTIRSDAAVEVVGVDHRRASPRP